jgi:PAS domain S-box-containing protein
MSVEQGTKPSSDRFLRILDTAPDAMVVVGKDGIIVFVNVQTESIFGYRRADLLGKPLDMLIPDRFRAAHGMHITRYFAHPGIRAMGSGLQLYGKRSDGTEIAIEVSLSPVETEEGTLVSAAIRDITDRKRIEAHAKLNADRLSSAVESIQDAFALFDAHDNLVLCNSVYRRLFEDAVKGPIVGTPYTKLLAAWAEQVAFDDEAERARFAQARLAHRDEPTSTFDVRIRDGRALRVSDRRTSEGGVVTTIWDITDDAKRAEELKLARTAAEAGSAAKSEFLSSMSHELRTPLNAILGFAQLLQRDKKAPLTDRHKERVDHILRGGEHLLRLIDDILDLSRIEAGGVSISTEPVDLGEVLDEVRTTLGPTAARAGVQIEVGEVPSGVRQITVDRTRFAQILMNFGSNAVKYNRSGGRVSFTVSTPEPGRVRVTISDTGMGIPLDKQDKLFQPFQRAGQETGPIEGTGIGLAISKRLAELMNGSVGFHSVPSEGSEFWVEMPTPTRQIMPPAEVVAPLAVPKLETRRGLVLYVEDNPANVTFMQDLLSTLDAIELVTAPTAEMGVELARGCHPNVIIMDINLPGMSGLDALRLLRELPETKSIPVIALTAAASERDRQRGERAGFYRYLTKPVKVDELEAALGTLLSDGATVNERVEE